jgi:hypothetical protein
LYSPIELRQQPWHVFQLVQKAAAALMQHSAAPFHGSAICMHRCGCSSSMKGSHRFVYDVIVRCRLLGVSKEASFEEIQDARNYLFEVRCLIM